MAQPVKNLALSLLWCGPIPGPETFMCHACRPKKSKREARSKEQGDQGRETMSQTLYLHLSVSHPKNPVKSAPLSLLS